MEDKRKHCTDCRNTWKEDWPGDKTALRCSADCAQKGYVVAIFPTGREATASGQPAPAWCTGYCKK